MDTTESPLGEPSPRSLGQTLTSVVAEDHIAGLLLKRGNSGALIRLMFVHFYRVYKTDLKVAKLSNGNMSLNWQSG